MKPKDQCLKISNRQLWPLFGNDYAQAACTLRKLLKENPTHPQLLHLAISIGLTSEVEGILKGHKIPVNIKATYNYRLNLKNKNLNKALDVISSKDYKELARGIIEQGTSKQKPISISVIDTAGIGDHLESYCFIHNWQKNSRLKFKIKTGKKRSSQLDRYCRTMTNISLSTGNENSLELYPFKYWLHKDHSNYFQHSIRDFSTKQQQKGVLCCWGAQGANELFSRHSRSVPFNLTYHFYRFIRNKKTFSSDNRHHELEFVGKKFSRSTWRSMP